MSHPLVSAFLGRRSELTLMPFFILGTLFKVILQGLNWPCQAADKFSSTASSLLIRAGAIAAAHSSCSADRNVMRC